MTRTPTDDQQFARILRRNTAIPLVSGVITSLVFVLLILFLLTNIRWVEHSDQVLNQANSTAREIYDLESSTRGFLLNKSAASLAAYESSARTVPAELAQLKDMVRDNPTQVARVARIQSFWDEYAVIARDVIAARQRDEDWQPYTRGGRGGAASQELRREFKTFLDTEQALRSERSASTRTTTVVAVAVFILLLLAAKGGLALFGRSEITRLSATYSDALARQAADAEALAQAAWLQTTENAVSASLLGQSSLEAVGTAALHTLSAETGAVAGAIYLRDLSGRLRRVASIGTPSDGDGAPPAEIAAGSGMASQAVQEGRVIALSPVPQGFLRAQSTLGSAVPESLLMGPIRSDGEVNGLVELGFYRALQARDSDLLRQVADTIGGAAEAARYKERLQDVLAETQQLNEELQVQQEELRTANEELEEQSRVLKESQASLVSQQAELEQTNDQLTEQATLLDARNTALKAAQEDLSQRAAELQQASRYKSEFLANMSHELRTPLNSSLILAKLLADNSRGNLDAEQVKYAESIYSAGNDLLHLINDILDISKVEAGKLDVRVQETSLARLLAGLRATFEPIAMDRELGFSIDTAAGVPDSLLTDPQRVEQILKNLLSNAMKFTERGQVALRVLPRGEGRVAFEVQDSGIGIRADQQDAIFEAFRQADGTTSRRYGGTGLGLSISRDLARLLGGGIAVKSTPGQGSTFTLELPVRYEEPAAAPALAPLPLAAPAVRPAPPPAAAPRPALPAPRAAGFQDDRASLPYPGRTVLVIEDEPQFAHILYDLAHELGYSCLVAHTTEEGMALAAEQRPQAVLLDMRLPDGSGLSVLERLKANAATRHIPVHVISVEDLAEAALHMGAVGYAPKPATREQLKEVFGKLEATLAQRLKRVLLVEDDKRQRDSVVALIGGEDETITPVGTGADALAQLRGNVFDCMVIDLSLPDMNGQELLKRMSAEDLPAFPPVIVYTGRNLTRDEEAELRKYSRSIIIKGARSPERLLDEVTLFLHQVETSLSNEQQSLLRAARNRDKVFDGRRILLVDDDVRNIFALTSALEHKGAIVEVGRNGFEAIDKLNTVPDIDLVLMDIMMPEMDGLEATRRIRADGRFGKLPIIAVTAKAMKDDQDQCLRAGANDYLAKPIDLDRLFSLLRVWMPKLERL